MHVRLLAKCMDKIYIPAAYLAKPPAAAIGVIPDMDGIGHLAVNFCHPFRLLWIYILLRLVGSQSKTHVLLLMVIL